MYNKVSSEAKRYSSRGGCLPEVLFGVWRLTAMLGGYNAVNAVAVRYYAVLVVFMSTRSLRYSNLVPKVLFLVLPVPMSCNLF